MVRDAAWISYSLDVGGNPSHDRDQLVQQRLVGRAEVGQRGHVLLRNHDDVHRPERARVVIGQNVIALVFFPERYKTLQRNVAIEVLARIVRG